MLVFSAFCFAYQLLNLREAPKLPGFFFIFLVSKICKVSQHTIAAEAKARYLSLLHFEVIACAHFGNLVSECKDFAGNLVVGEEAATVVRWR